MTDPKRRRSDSRGKRYALALLAGLLLAGGLAALLGVEPFDPDASSPSQAAPDRGAVEATSGYLGQFVDSFTSGMSRSDPYAEPSKAAKARLARAYTDVRAGKLHRAARLARPLGYRVVRYLDRLTGHKLVLLVERGGRRRGWGLYVHSPGSRSKLIVEVPHPKYDIKSEKVGVQTFRLADAADLFVAGTHRYAAPNSASDPAHAPQSAFEAVHRSVLASGGIVLQPHGFDASNRGEEYGEIVVSSGGPPTGLVRSLTRSLRAEGHDTCLYRAGRCGQLGGTRNAQGRSARAARASFVHVEMARRLREQPALRRRIASILARRLR